MAAPNPSCPSYKRWRGVSKREHQRAAEDTKPPIFKSNVNIYVPPELQDLLQTKPKNFTPDDLKGAVTAIKASDSRQWLGAVTAIRRALSRETQPHIQEVVDLGALPRLVYMMSLSDQPQLQLEAAWAVCNVASGNSQQCAAVVEAGALPPAIAMLATANPALREQAAWLLGNIAGDGAALRDACVEAGLLPPLLAAVKKETELRPLRQFAWLLLNVTRFKPRRRSMLLEVLPTLTSLVATSRDPEALADGLSAVAHVADDCMGEVVAGARDAVTLAAGLLNEESTASNVAVPAAKVLSALCAGDDVATQAVVDTGVLAGGYRRFLKKGEPAGVLREVCFALSNIAAGTQEQAKAVRDAVLLPPLVRAFRRCNNATVRREAVWALANMSSKGTDLCNSVLEAGAAPVLADYLAATADSTNQTEVTAGTAAAEALLALVKAGANGGSNGDGGGSSNPVVQTYREEGVYDTLQRAVDKGLKQKALLHVQQLLQEFRLASS